MGELHLEVLGASCDRFGVEEKETQDPVRETIKAGGGSGQVQEAD
jgi:hypothetical protein